jgi:predicted nucleic acid-binding protein
VILVDTSVIVAWLDQHHPQHRACLAALESWAQRDRLAFSDVDFEFVE